MISAPLAQVPPPAVAVPDRLTKRRPTLDALTGIRFFAALYVVLYHSKLPEAVEGVGLRHTAWFLENGSLAVLLFFLLSGFILSYTYEGQIETGTHVRRFWEARFARIWPLYAVSLLLSTLVLHNTPAPRHALATLAMVQAWNPANVGMAGTWNFVCWTLSTEALFYLLFPLLQLGLERCRAAVQVAVMAAMMAVAVTDRSPLHVFGIAVTGAYQHIPLAMLHVPEFVIGVCLGNLFLLRKAGVPALAGLPLGNGIWTWAAAVASVGLLCQPPGRVVTLTAVTFAVLLFGLAGEASLLRRVLSSRLLLIGGQISYGMYLLQWPCKMEINRICDALHADSAALRFFLDLAVLIAISAAGFYGIEDPSRKLIRKMFAVAERMAPKRVAA